MIARTLTLLVLLTPSGALANTPADYAVTLPIATPANTEASAWRVELTPQVYAWVQNVDLGDMEVFNASGTPVPFARSASASTPPREQDVSVPLLALPATNANAPTRDLRLIIDRDAAGHLRRIDANEQQASLGHAADHEWLLDASDIEHPLDALLLVWQEPAAGIVARFTVDASDDLEHWRFAGTGTVLALEQDGMRLDRHAISLGGIRAKYLRLHRLDEGPALGGLTVKAHLIQSGALVPARAWIDATSSTAAGGSPAPPGITRFDYTVAAPLPIDAARAELANDNALAPLTLFACKRGAVDDAWTKLAEVNAFRLRLGNQTIRNSDMEFTASSRLRHFRIESHVPIASPPGLTLGYRPDSFVFLAEGAGPYVLAVGSARAHRADYPIDAALASLRAKAGEHWNPPLARLGTPAPSGGLAMLQPPPPSLPWRRWLLWGVLIAAAALVGGFALSLLRDANRSGQ